jgi:hypothetical protein
LNEHISVVSYRVYIYIPDTTVASYTLKFLLGAVSPWGFLRLNSSRFNI